jgi:hypothetical protein
LQEFLRFLYTDDSTMTWSVALKVGSWYGHMGHSKKIHSPLLTRLLILDPFGNGFPEDLLGNSLFL